MSLAEAHTENVKRAWAAKMWERDDFQNNTGRSRAEYCDSVAKKGCLFGDRGLSLAEALDLLAWCCRECAIPYQLNIWSGAWYLDVPHTIPQQSGGRLEDEGLVPVTKAMLLAVDAIVEKHPEVLESAD